MANMAFPTFHGRSDEDAATDFMDNLEVACVVFGRDDDVSHLRLFPSLLKAEARTWFNALLPAVKADWGGLRMAFMQRFGAQETYEKLWENLCELRAAAEGGLRMLTENVRPFFKEAAMTTACPARPLSDEATRQAFHQNSYEVLSSEDALLVEDKPSMRQFLSRVEIFVQLANLESQLML
ncbi:hypothetical protein L7F22_013944 [Adiantum nelumboides]|nr:hypothetical protein [Adiantum nelumboides]